METNKLNYTYTPQQRILIIELYDFANSPIGSIVVSDRDYIKKYVENIDWTQAIVNYSDYTRNILNKIRKQYIAYK